MTTCIPPAGILLIHPRLSTARSGTSDFVSAAAHCLVEKGISVSLFTSSASKASVATDVRVEGFGPECGWRSFGNLFRFAASRRGSVLSFQWTCPERGNVGFAFGVLFATIGLRFLGHNTHVYLHQLWEPWGTPLHWPRAILTRSLTLGMVFFSRRTSAPVKAWSRLLRGIFFYKASRIAWVPVGATILPKHRSRGSMERQGHPWVLLFNPLSTTKNPHLVEAAWARLAQKAPHTQCAVIGKLPPREDTRLSYLLKHPDCSFLGVIRPTQVSEWMCRSLALLAPFDEGVSGCRTSVISALAHGLPVVTTRGPATESIWGKTEGVILVDRNPEDLADALLRLHLDESYWERASQAAHAFYKAHFDWVKVLEMAYPEFGTSHLGTEVKPRLRTAVR